MDSQGDKKSEKKRTVQLEEAPILKGPTVRRNKSEEFEFEEPPAYERRIRKKPVQPQQPQQNQPISIEADSKIDRRYYVESKNKPVWSSPKRKTQSSPPHPPVDLTGVVKSSPPPIFHTPPPQMELTFGETTPKAKQETNIVPETDAWNLIEEDQDNVKRAKLVSQSSPVMIKEATTPRTGSRSSSKKTSPLKSSEDFQKITSLYEKLITTPKKSPNQRQREPSADSPSSSPSRDTSTTTTTRIQSSPRKLKTYSLMRSFRQDQDSNNNDEEDIENIEESHHANSSKNPNNKSSIADLNQLRANGRNMKIHQEIEYFIDEFDSINTNTTTDHKLLRSTALELVLKQLSDDDFATSLGNTREGFPRELLMKFFESTDFTVQCCLLLLYISTPIMSDTIISQLQENQDKINNLLIDIVPKFAKAEKSQAMSKINTITWNKILDLCLIRFVSKDPITFYRFFLQKYKNYIELPLAIVDFKDSSISNEDTFMNLCIIESILEKNPKVILSTDQLNKLIELCISDQTEIRLLQSCQVIALKSMILMSSFDVKQLSEPHTVKLLHSLNRKLEVHNNTDPILQNIILLQIGLLLNHVEYIPLQEFRNSNLIQHVPDNIESIDHGDTEIHLIGYICLIAATLVKTNKEANKDDKIYNGLKFFYNNINEFNMQERIKDILDHY